jgi:hypothetical protein
MRRLTYGALALVLAAGFAGCSQGGSAALNPVDTDPKAVEALVAKLETEAFKGKATAAADLTAMREALPSEMTLEWDNLTFEAATASTLLTEVRIGLASLPGVGVGIDELRLYDFDAGLATARLNGQRLTETAPLAARIDARGVSLFGLAEMLNGAMGATPAEEAPPEAVVADDPFMSDDLQEPTEPSFTDDDAMFVSAIDRLDLSFGRIILNDVVMRPFEAIAAPASAQPGMMTELYGPGADIMTQYIGVMRAFGIDTFAAYDMKADFAMREMGESISLSLSAKTQGTRGMRGGDIDASFLRGLQIAFNMGEPSAPDAPVTFSYTIDYTGMEDMRFDTLYAHMAKGTMPARTETDVLSYGRMSMENQAMVIDGREIMTVGEAVFDARKFHWLIPTELTASASDAKIDLAAITELATQFASDMENQYLEQFGDPGLAGDGFAPAPSPDFSAVAATMEKYGFAKPNMNFNFGWNWNALSGDTKIDLGFGGENLMQFAFKYEGGFPDFKSVSDLIPDDPLAADMDAVGQVFAERSKLKLVSLNVTDSGGLGKIFDLAAEMGPVLAASDPSGFNPFEGQTGASLRQMAGGALTMLGASPEFAPFITPMSNFIMEGGKLTLAMQPAQAMTLSALGELMTRTDVSPTETFKQLGLKVEHAK